MTRTWRALASESVFDHTSVNEVTGANAIRHILRAIQQLTRKLWLGRNKSLHDGKETAMHSIRQEELSEIRELHENPDLVPAGDRHYCTGSLADLTNRSPSVRRRWLRHMRRARIRYTNEGKRQMKITSFFTSRKM